MSKEEKLKALLDKVTEKAANRIMPRVKLLNGRLRGPHNKIAMRENEAMLSEFVTQIYGLGLEDGYNLKESESLIK